MWFSPINFEHPAFLLLLPLVVLVVLIVDRRSKALLGEVSRRQLKYLRIIELLLIVLAAAGMVSISRSNRLTTIFLLDVSDSVSASQRASAIKFINAAVAKKNSNDRVGLVIFGKEPSVVSAPADGLDLSRLDPDVSRDATNLQSGIEAAAGLMPQDTAKRIVLLTDGDENVGGAMKCISSLATQGVQVDVAPVMLYGNRDPEVLVERVATPSHVSVKEPFNIRVVLSSNVAQSARLSVTRNGTPIFAGAVELHNGKTAVYCSDILGRGGVYTYVAELSSKSDTRPENNTASSVVLVSGQPKVLLIRNRNEPLPSALPGALRAQGLDVSQMSPADAPQNEAGLSGYDSIILSDVADGDLSPRQITAIAEANQNFGVGLGMMGGINSFAAGGYVGTPIEDALPVLMTPKSRKEIPGADVVIVLDASGSMSADENGLEKVEIAARAALNLLSALQPQDRVAVLAVTETASIVMPLVTPAEAAHYVPSIESVDAGGGGIDCRNGLEAAYTMLQTSDAEIKHVIICPDTTDSEQQEGCVALANAVYKEAKISTSVCGIGQWTDSDVPFQRSLAKAGHGQLFVANQAGNLPQFFKRDVQSTKEKLFAEGVFGVIEKVSDPVLSGLSGQPAILGYNLVTAKPGASTPVVLSGDSDPLVAYWRNGSGKSFAFTSDDDAHWAQRWLGWPGYPPFWSKLVRWSLRSSDDQSFQTSVSNVNGVGHIVVDAYSSAGYSTTGAFKASIAEPDGALKQAILAETAPGRYESDFDSTEIGAYLIQVHNVNSGGGQMASISTSYSPEYSDEPPNVLLLAQIAKQTAGMMLTSPRQAFRPSSSPHTNSKSLVNVLLILASVLFVLDVAWRRFGWHITQQSVRDTAGVAAEGAIAAAGSISRSITPKPLDSAAFIRAPIKPGSVEGELLRSRTAVRADMDDDNPFPYVASLPPRPRKESIEIEKKEEE